MENKTEKPKRLLTYKEEEINHVLAVLGELPAKESFYAITALRSPVKAEAVHNEAETQE